MANLFPCSVFLHNYSLFLFFVQVSNVCPIANGNIKFNCFHTENILHSLTEALEVLSFEINKIFLKKKRFFQYNSFINITVISLSNIDGSYLSNAVWIVSIFIISLFLLLVIYAIVLVIAAVASFQMKNFLYLVTYL